MGGGAGKKRRNKEKEKETEKGENRTKPEGTEPGSPLDVPLECCSTLAGERQRSS